MPLPTISYHPDRQGFQRQPLLVKAEGLQTLHHACAVCYEALQVIEGLLVCRHALVYSPEGLLRLCLFLLKLYQFPLDEVHRQLRILPFTEEPQQLCLLFLQGGQVPFGRLVVSEQRGIGAFRAPAVDFPGNDSGIA
jgi:hypothetical protein